MTISVLELLRGALLAIPPLCLAAAVLPSVSRPLARACDVTAGMVVLAMAGCVGVAADAGEGVVSTWAMDAIRVDAVTVTMMLLVAFIAVVIARYSRSALEGDDGARRYERAFLLTLAAVTTLLLSNHLLLVFVAWSLTGMALHPLLTHFHDRPAALVAAHKKFLVGRMADVVLLGAAFLLHHHAGTLHVDGLAAWAAQQGDMPAGAQVAALLLVAGVALKSAQLPFHGWLIQVMEAPTPVSALMHAGVVNMGGYVMIRMGDVMAHFPAAQLALVAAGTTTAVVAALVMTTRVSIKVALAWSTCAQMGFMLLQCGLGAYHLALLHLVAHSLYKARAFLRAGSTVDHWRVADLLSRGTRTPVVASSMGAVFALCCGALAYAAAGGPGHGGEMAALWAVVMALALSPSLFMSADEGARAVASTLLAGSTVALLAVGWHALAARMFPALASRPVPPGGVVLVGAAMLVLFVVQAWQSSHSTSAAAQRVYRALFAGLLLDERFTRVAFRAWPPRLPTVQPESVVGITAGPHEA